MNKKNYLAIFAKSFNWAGFFLPKKVYEDCAKLYAFCRILDDIADEKSNLDFRIEKFTKIKNFFKESFDLPNNKKLELNDIHNKIASVGHDTDEAKASEDVYDELPMCCQYRDGSPH